MRNRSGNEYRSGIAMTAVALSALALILAGCTQTPRSIYNVSEARAASIVGFEDIRTYLDADLDKAPTDPKKWVPSPTKRDVNVLMISGGGAGGAFTVGILAAWSETGKRPIFDVVTASVQVRSSRLTLFWDGDMIRA